MDAPNATRLHRSFILVADLRERGWTDTLIQRFLPDPDETRTNPHYRSGPRMKLYALGRVLGIESSTEFVPSLGRVLARRDAKAKAHEEWMKRFEAEKQEKERQRKKALRTRFRGYPGWFKRRYSERESTESIAKACGSLFALNRYAKHEGAPKEEIYRLKDRVLRLLWDMGFCKRAQKVKSPGDDFYGISGSDYWAFQFEVDGVFYSWHQPCRLAHWASVRGEPDPHVVLARIKEVQMNEKRLQAGLAILYWVVGDI
jgi:hypothetical protein